MTVETDIDASEVLQEIRRVSSLTVSLSERFYPTPLYRKFERSLFTVLEDREALLLRGHSELKGVALIGPPGSGKSRMARRAGATFQTLAAKTEGGTFGSKIISVIVPGRASVKDTCKEILRELGYDIQRNRDEDYLLDLVTTLMEEHRVAGLHLDEVQDAGRYTTEDSRRQFSKRFRNLVQTARWPVSLILSGTMESMELLNEDQTLSRRCRPTELFQMDEEEGAVMKHAIEDMLSEVGLKDDGLVESDEFRRRLVHAAAYRFGLSIEIAIEAIGEALTSGDTVINVDHFADAYYVRTNGDDDLNPFVVQKWKHIDTTKLMDRYLDEKKDVKKRPPTK